MAVTIKSRFSSFLLHPHFGPIVMVVVCAALTLQNYMLSKTGLWADHYTFYNNFVIFKQSFFHLLHDQNLYLLYPEEHYDYFKYSPSFALFMVLFSWIPDIVGLFFWNLLNCLVVYYAIKNIRGFNQKNHLFILGFVFLELIVSTMASQSNLLVGGIILFAFNNLEKEKPGNAALLIVMGIFIKLFAGFAGLLFLFYPKKTQFLFYVVLWSLVLLFAPLIITSPENLISQYKGWLTLLNEDRTVSNGMSIYTILFTFFGFVNKNLVLLGGFILLVLPLLKIRHYTDYGFRLWYLSAILIWIIVFNHKGESPTYVIALVGCALWGVATRPSLLLKIILFVTWFFSSFIKSDVFPRSIRQGLHPDFTNALMPSLVFIIIITTLIGLVKTFRYKNDLI